MAETKSQTRRLLGVLRRAARPPKGAAGAPSDVNAAWLAHEQALSQTRDAAEAAQRVASNAAKQRGAADALVDRAHAVATRAHELTGRFSRVTDAFERLALVALNAGLEGARLGDVAGRSLLLLGDEVRGHAARGGEAARELAAALGEVAAEVAKLETYVDQARVASSDAAQDAARVAAATAAAERALAEVAEGFRKVTGSDPETARALAQATEHARALVGALAGLRGHVPRPLLLGALSPMMKALARVLNEEDTREGDHA